MKIKVLEKRIIKQFCDSWSLKTEKLQGQEVLAMKNISLEFLHFVP